MTLPELVFGLDIGTRSIVGTVGYLDKDKFVVVCQRVKEHETRSMLDGQIHDIGKVAETIKSVKSECEEAIGKSLKQVCIAAAGRVLQTLDTHIDLVFEEERETTKEDVSNLMSLGVEKAYREFVPSGNSDLKFYCVGYSVVKYYLNSYQIGNLVGHKAKQISADIIATFLPDDVVDGLYRAVELAGLEVSNLTLEPIAAISVAIPERFRMLNIALVDVGAGTSDISITRDGSIVAYGMIPQAGDSFTEAIAMHCLVDFDMAEKIKRESMINDVVEYEDIMCLPQTISSDEVQEIIKDNLDDITTKISDEIMRLNGDKPVSAVFVVGGGGIIKGFTEMISSKLGIQKERVALRGSEVMGKIEFLEEVNKTSLLVTPIGICMNYYESHNNLMYVTFNGNRIKMYDNGHISVVDVCMQAGFPNDGLFPKRGKAITYSVNGKSKIAKGDIGEAAVITINGQPADINRKVACNDKINISESTKGVRARIKVNSLPEFKSDISFVINKKTIKVPRPVFVNDKPVLHDYEIMDDDVIVIPDFCYAASVLEALDLGEGLTIKVNNQFVDSDFKVYENFDIQIVNSDERYSSEYLADDDSKSHSYVAETESGTSSGDSNVSGLNDNISKANEEKAEEDKVVSPKIDLSRGITIFVNKLPVRISGKPEYVFVDVFDFIDFDLSSPKGKELVMTHNGNRAGHLDPLSEGDVLEIYWKD